MNGVYLALQLRHRVIQPILAFREYIFRDVLPHFADLKIRAYQISREQYDHAVSQPATEDFDGDLSTFAEDAHDYALGWYQMMKSLRQTMLNLLAAGLFHLTEQQLAQLSNAAGFEGRMPKEAKLEELVRWYKSTLRLDLRDLTSWPIIDELRLVANTAKHAEGKSSRELRKQRPGVFIDPSLSGTFAESAIEEYLVHRSVSAPMAGEDLFVTESLLTEYAKGVESLFREIQMYLEEHVDDYY